MQHNPRDTFLAVRACRNRTVRRLRHSNGNGKRPMEKITGTDIG